MLRAIFFVLMCIDLAVPTQPPPSSTNEGTDEGPSPLLVTDDSPSVHHKSSLWMALAAIALFFLLMLF